MNTKENVKLFLDNPTSENFEIIRDSRVALFLVYYALEKGVNLLQYLTFNEYILMYNDSGGSLRTFLREKIEREEKSLDEWRNICDISSGDLKELILMQMKKLTKTFKQWLSIYRRADKNSELKRNAWENMRDLAKTFEEWEIIYDDIDYDAKMLALGEMKKLL